MLHIPHLTRVPPVKVIGETLVVSKAKNVCKKGQIRSVSRVEID